MKNFWQTLPKPFFALAPMEDVTNTVFRHVIAEAAAPDLYFTEFTNVQSYCHPEGKMSVRGRLTFTEDENPILAHIWGDIPEQYEIIAKDMAEAGYSGIDINTGCPARNVVKSGNGAGLIKRPEKLAQLIAAAKTGGIPVSVKTRLGYSKLEEMYEWIPFLLRQDLANITIHLRTKREMSDGDAHYEVIPEILKMRDEIAPNTLITINGDIANRQEGMALVEKYPGVDGVMIGRGVFQDPFAFEKEKQEHSPAELFSLFRHHLNLFDEYQEEYGDGQFLPLRRSFKIYVRGIRGAADLRNELMQANNTAEARELLDKFEADNPEIF